MFHNQDINYITNKYSLIRAKYFPPIERKKTKVKIDPQCFINNDILIRANFSNPDDIIIDYRFNQLNQYDNLYINELAKSMKDLMPDFNELNLYKPTTYKFGSTIKNILINIHENINTEETLDNLQKWIIFYYFYIAKDFNLSFNQFRDEFYKYFIIHHCRFTVQEQSYDLETQMRNIFFYLRHVDFSSMIEHFGIVIKLIEEKYTSSHNDINHRFIYILKNFIDYCDKYNTLISNNQIEYSIKDFSDHICGIKHDIKYNIDFLIDKQNLLDSDLSMLLDNISEIYKVLFDSYEHTKKLAENVYEYILMINIYRIFEMDRNESLRKSKVYFTYPKIFDLIFNENDFLCLEYIKDFNIWMKYLCILCIYNICDDYDDKKLRELYDQIEVDFFNFITTHLILDIQIFHSYFNLFKNRKIIYDNEYSEYINRVILLNIKKEFNKDKIDTIKLLEIIDYLELFKLKSKNKMIKYYLHYIFNYLFDNEFYLESLHIYKEIIGIEDSFKVFNKFYYKICQDKCINEKLKSVLDCDNIDENVTYLKSLIMFEENLKKNDYDTARLNSIRDFFNNYFARDKIPPLLYKFTFKLFEKYFDGAFLKFISFKMFKDASMICRSRLLYGEVIFNYIKHHYHMENNEIRDYLNRLTNYIQSKFDEWGLAAFKINI